MAAGEGRSDDGADAESALLADVSEVLDGERTLWRAAERMVACPRRRGRSQPDCSWCDTPYTWDTRRYDLSAETRRAVGADRERWISSCRREATDKILILGERHLRTVLIEYIDHYDPHRPRRTLQQQAPDAKEPKAEAPDNPIKIRRHDRSAD